MEPNTSEKSYRTYVAAALVVLVFAIASVGAIMWMDSSNTHELEFEKGVIEVYPSNQRELNLLRLLEFKSFTQVYRITLPSETKHCKIVVNTLNSDGSWHSVLHDSIIGKKALPLPKLFAFRQNLDDSIDIQYMVEGEVLPTLNYLGTIPAPKLSFESLAGTAGFSWEVQPIVLDKEIPIAFLALSEDGETPTMTLADYYDTSNLTGYDFVRIVTMMFSASP